MREIPRILFENSQDATFLLGDVRYHKGLHIGTGSTANVYRAQTDQRESLHPVIALKMLHANSRRSTAVERFCRETELLCTLSHPNLVRGLGKGVVDDLPVLAMEYVPGKTLEERLRISPPFTPTQVVDMVIQLAAVLNYLYIDGRVFAHRDLKPSNILLDANMTPKIIDLGVARTQVRYERELDARFIGTIRYMAPEQIHDPAHVDVRADFYALGIIFYEMLSSHRAFDGWNGDSILNEHLKECHLIVSRRDRPMIGEETRSACNAIIRRLTYRNLLDRYQTPSAILTDLKALKENLSSEDLQRAQDTRLSHAGCTRTPSRETQPDQYPIGLPTTRYPDNLITTAVFLVGGLLLVVLLLLTKQ